MTKGISWVRRTRLAPIAVLGVFSPTMIADDAPCVPTIDFLGEYRTPATANQVEVEHSIAYVVDWFPNQSLQILDVNDPSAPVFLGALPITTSPVGFSVENSMVYLPGTSMRIIDTTNPASPNLVGIYGDGGPVRDVVTRGTLAYIAKTDAFQIIDVSDPTSPTMIGTSENMTAAAEFVAIEGSRAYVSDFVEGVLQIFDIADPSSPDLMGSFAGLNFPTDICAVGTTVYITDFTGMHIIDASDPNAPIPQSFTRIGIAKGISVHGEIVYIAGGNGLELYDVSDPGLPVSIGSYRTPQASRGISVVGEVAYVADDSFGLQMYNVLTDCGGCLIEFTGDGVLDIFDVFAFLQLFNDGSQLADLDANGILDVFDVFSFVDSYGAGCP